MSAEGSGARPWEIVARQLVARCHVFDVERLHTRSPRTGELHERHVLRVRDWVNVVPFTDDGHVIMVEQYRFGAGVLSLEFPAGILEADEDPTAGAARELREETGYEPATTSPVTSVYADPALQDNRLHVVVARGCRQVSSPDQDEGEDVHVRLVPVEEVARLIREGAIQHALAITAWYLATAEGCQS